MDGLHTHLLHSLHSIADSRGIKAVVVVQTLHPCSSSFPLSWLGSLDYVFCPSHLGVFS